MNHAHKMRPWYLLGSFLKPLIFSCGSSLGTYYVLLFRYYLLRDEVGKVSGEFIFTINVFFYVYVFNVVNTSMFLTSDFPKLIYFLLYCPKGMLAGRIIFSMVFAKVAITIAFDLAYVYSAELFPTVMRSDDNSYSFHHLLFDMTLEHNKKNHEIN